MGKIRLSFALLTLVGCAANESPTDRILAGDALLAARTAPTDRDHGFAALGGEVTSSGWRATDAKSHLSAKLSPLASGATEIRIGHSESHRLLFQAEGANASAVVVDRGRARYANAYPSTDLLYVANDMSVEWLLLLNDPAAPTKFAWQIETGAGFAKTRSDGAGGLSFTDAGGKVLLRMPRPYAIDARGVRRDADLRKTGDRIELSLDTSKLTYPIVLDPVVQGEFWSLQTRGIESAALQYQRPVALQVNDCTLVANNQGKTFMFGAPIVSPVGSDAAIESWNGTTWSNTAASSLFTQGEEVPAASVFDTASNDLILVGFPFQCQSCGEDDTCCSATQAELYHSDGTTVTRGNSHLPFNLESISGSSLAYDATRNVVVYLDAAMPPNLWESTDNGATFTQPAGAMTNGPTGATSIAYDSSRNKMVAVECVAQSTDCYYKAWEWDGSVWTAGATTAVPEPTPFVVDTGHGSIAAVAKGVAPSLWNGTSWTQASVVAPNDVAGVTYDSHRQVVVAVSNARASGDNRTTYEWSGTSSATWNLISSNPAPLLTSQLTTYDSQNNVLVVFGVSSANVAETWLWDGTSWTNATSSTSPGARGNSAMAYDAGRGVVVLFGGVQLGSGNYLNDVWEWNTGTKSWTQPMPVAPLPQNRDDHALAYDGSKIVLFGGAAKTGPNFSDTWTWDGTGWNSYGGSGPTARHNHAMAYVNGQGALLCGGLNHGNSALNELWRWNGSSWMMLTPTGATPPYYANLSIAFDSMLSRLMVTGTLIDNTVGATFYWDQGSNSWVQSITSNLNVEIAYDTHQSQLLGFDGATVYRFSRIGNACASDSDCPGVYCNTQDLVCCTTKTCGTCQTCAGSYAGSCQEVENAPDDTCSGNNICSPNGECLLKLGQTCGTSLDCASGQCAADNTCCSTVCTDSCQVCSLAHGASADGTCSTAPRGYAGVACGNYACGGSSAPVPTSCQTTCTVDDQNTFASADCATENYCIGGGCAEVAPQGHTCGRNSDCQSNFCVDGYCCDSDCTGSCQRCDLPATLGTCTVATGLNPTDRGAAPCGTGTCAGTCSSDNACAKPGSETSCDVCAVCDGTGGCTLPPPSGDDAQCGTIACGGLSTECVVFNDLTMMRCERFKQCAAPSDPATCTTMTNKTDGTACTGGACMKGTCVQGAMSTGDGGTTKPGGGTTKPGGGCSFTGRTPEDATSSTTALALLFMLLISTRRRNHRSL